MTGYVQLNPDTTATGKQLDNDVVQMPPGTIITNPDGSTTVLQASAYYYRERVVNADPTDPRGLATVRNLMNGPSGQDYGLTVQLPPGQPDFGAIITILQDIDAVLNQMMGQQPMGAVAPQIPPLSAITIASLGSSLISPTTPRPLLADRFGRLITRPLGPRAIFDSQETTITSASETTIVNAVQNTYCDIVSLLIANTSATAVRVDIRDQLSTVARPPSTNGIIPMYIPAGDMRGISFAAPPLHQTNVNQTWTATVSSAVTDIRVWAYFAMSTP